MKGILEFNLPEEQSEFQTALDAGEWVAAVDDYARWLRDICKHQDPSVYDAVQCSDKLWSILRERGLDPYG